MDFTDRFDRYVMLTMSDRKDRQRYMDNQMRGFLGDAYGVFSNDRLRVFYGTRFPFNDIIAEAFNRSGKGHFTKPNEYDCARNHYSIVRQALDDESCESVLIFEDDIRFMKDRDVWTRFMENIPDDFDILQFGGFTTDPGIDSCLEKDPHSATRYWTKHPKTGLWNCSMYALSRKGMSYYLAFMDKMFWVADGPLYKAPLNHKIVNTYVSTIPLVIQADKHVIKSDIRNESNDRIDYENDNMYERHIDKNDYLDFDF